MFSCVFPQNTEISRHESCFYKAELKYFLGTLNLLLSPKQLHVLIELVEDINKLINKGKCYDLVRCEL